MKLHMKVCWRFVSLSLIILLVLMTVTACGSPPAQTSKSTTTSTANQGQPQYGGILRIVEGAEGAMPIGVPWEIKGNDGKLIKPAIESLVLEDTKGNYSPWLADSWKIDTEKKMVTISLKKGIKFHDGTDFNATAVKWNLQHQIDAKNVPFWKSVDVIDDYTVRINLTEYQNNFLDSISYTYGGMISPTAFEKNGIDWARWNAVGTGPFKFQSYSRGTEIKYTRNDNYWIKGLPYLDGIQYLLIKDPMTQQAAMKANGPEKIDVLSVTVPETAMMMKSSGFEVISAPVRSITLIPDSTDPNSPLSNQKVREAISYAIDREGIVKARGFGHWSPAYQIPLIDTASYIKDIKQPYDPNKAKRLLTEAGYPNGFKTTIYAMPGMNDKDALAIVQRNLSQIGIQAELEFPDNGGYNNLKIKGWSGMLSNVTRGLATFNITYNTYLNISPNQFPKLQRPKGFLDKLSESLKTPNPEPTRGQELTKMLIDDQSVIPLYYSEDMYVMQKNVHDTGYLQWSSSTVSSPEKTWLSK